MNNIKLQGINIDGIEKEYSLNDFKGQKVILYFYPKDNTSGCTQEACDFRDNINRLTSFATVIGVSPDSIKSHLKFKEKQSLNFILLSDPEHKLAEAFNVWVEKSMYGRKYMGIERSTFVLDENLNIIKEWRKVKVKGHVDEVIDYIINKHGFVEIDNDEVYVFRLCGREIIKRKIYKKINNCRNICNNENYRNYCNSI